MRRISGWWLGARGGKLAAVLTPGVTMRIGSSITALTLMLAVGCGGAEYGGMSEADEAADIAAVEAVVSAEMGSLVAGDVAANVALLTDDAVIMPPNEPALAAAEADAFFAAFLEAFAVSAGEYVSHDISIHGDIAIDIYHGELTLTPAGSDETVIESLKGIHVLERQADGSWKISYDIWNSNDPGQGM